MIATGIRVFFCDAHKPWRRGSNGGTDLSVHSADDIAGIARSLNGRRRKTLE